MISYVMLVFVLLFILLFFYFVPLGLWIQAVVSLGVGRITIIDLIRMRLRKIAPRLVVDGVINCHKSGLNTITTDMLETHYLAGGTVPNIVSALIAAAKANIQVYLRNPAGIGEHPDIIAAIDEQVEIAAAASEKLDYISGLKY